MLIGFYVPVQADSLRQSPASDAEVHLAFAASTPELKLRSERIGLTEVYANCPSDLPCNCRSGSYGYCTTEKECKEVGGTCS
ncbi:hypothetical protein G6F63_016957 [Rhizopus arrhizus]|nr:hypothetical protein G6F63_016957 [Rhizopus arrhizus]